MFILVRDTNLGCELVFNKLTVGWCKPNQITKSQVFESIGELLLLLRKPNVESIVLGFKDITLKDLDIIFVEKTITYKRLS